MLAIMRKDENGDEGHDKLEKLTEVNPIMRQFRPTYRFAHLKLPRPLPHYCLAYTTSLVYSLLPMCFLCITRAWLCDFVALFGLSFPTFTSQAKSLAKGHVSNQFTLLCVCVIEFHCFRFHRLHCL